MTPKDRHTGLPVECPRIVPFLLVLAALGATGFFLATGNPFDSKPKATPAKLYPPNTKAGAEQLVIVNAAKMLTPLIRPKFVDPLTGLLSNNDFAQCYPSTTTSGWWVCELDSYGHPRPVAWFSVSYAGLIREKGEQPLGYGWVPTPAPVGVAPDPVMPSGFGP